jgi:hypothetical protein
VGALFVAATYSVAAILDFDEFTHDSTPLWGGVNFVGSAIEADGFVIQSCYGRCGPDNLAVYGRFEPYQADWGHAAVLVWHADLPITIARDDGLPFDLFSIDFGPPQIGFGVDNELTFTYSDGSTQSLRTGIANSPETGLKTFILDQHDLLSVHIRGWSTGGIGQFDNIVLNETPRQVPEPGTLPLVTLTLAVACLMPMFRKRRHVPNRGVPAAI